MKKKIILTGSLLWNKFRDLLVDELEKCNSEEEFLFVLNMLLESISHSEEEMQRKRRRLGIKET